MEELSGKLVRLFDQAKKMRTLRESDLRDVSKYLMPNRGDFGSSTSLTSRGVFDTTGIEALKSLSSVIINGLTPPSMKWLTGSVDKGQFKGVKAVKDWLSAVEHYLLDNVFNEVDSGFAQQNAQFIKDTLAYGTGCMFIERLEKQIIFTAIHLEQVYFFEDYTGKPDTVFRSYQMTPRQIEAKFGAENMSQGLIDRLETCPNDMEDCLHIVMPKKDYERAGGVITRENVVHDFVSIHMCQCDKHIMSIKGYYELPYIIARWDKRTNEIYGVGPGIDSLPNVLTANKIRRLLIAGVEFSIMPTTLVSDDSVIKPESIRPGAIIPVEFDQNGRPMMQTLNQQANLRDGEAILQSVRLEIKSAFFVDKLDQREGTPATATEILDNQQIRISLTGPHINRFESEYLSQIVERAFSLEQRAGTLPPPPPELDGMTVKFKFQSPLSKAQRQQELLSLNKVFGATQIILQSHPEVLDVYDPDKLQIYYSDLGGIPPEVMRSEAAFASVRNQRKEQQAQQQQQSSVSDASGVIKNLSQADALSRQTS